MDCDRFRLHIDAYADGALSPAERATFEAHSTSCVECQQAIEQVQRLNDLLRTELSRLAAATPSEQVSLREGALSQLGIPTRPGISPPRPSSHKWILRLTAMVSLLVVILLAALILPPGEEQTASAAEIVERAQATAEQHQGMNGVLHWEAEWSQRFPGGDQITRTFEIWFSFDNPGKYHLTQRDPDGRVYNEMVRDGVDHMWHLSRVVSDAGHERLLVDEIVLSPEEMEELASWYIPSPSLDDLDRFTDVLSSVDKVTTIEMAGRQAYVLRGQLFGFGRPTEGNRIDPITSTVQLVVDAETYWVLGRIERVPQTGQQNEIAAGVVQRTRRFEILSLEQIPAGVFDFSPPPGAEVRTVEGIDGYYAPAADAIDLDDAAALTSFTLVLPSDLPDDLQPRPHFRYQGPGRAGTFGIVYLGHPGRQAFLLEYEQAVPLARAARSVPVGDKQGWLVPDPIDGHKFSLYIVEPQPAVGPDGRTWPGGIELQVWGLSLDEATALLASLKPYHDDVTPD
jgi:outer membrane lipoprotein-sorting protein